MDTLKTKGRVLLALKAEIFIDDLFDLPKKPAVKFSKLLVG